MPGGGKDREGHGLFVKIDTHQLAAIFRRQPEISIIGRRIVKKITALSLCLCIFAGLLCACGTPSTGNGAAEEISSENDNNTGSAEIKMVLHEPKYLKPSDINHKPVFTLSWDPYPNAYSYEFAIYVEGEDSYGRGPFAIRSTKGIKRGLYLVQYMADQLRGRRIYCNVDRSGL